ETNARVYARLARDNGRLAGPARPGRDTALSARSRYNEIAEMIDKAVPPPSGWQTPAQRYVAEPRGKPYDPEDTKGLLEEIGRELRRPLSKPGAVAADNLSM